MANPRSTAAAAAAAAAAARLVNEIDRFSSEGDDGSPESFHKFCVDNFEVYKNGNLSSRQKWLLKNLPIALQTAGYKDRAEGLMFHLAEIVDREKNALSLEKNALSLDSVRVCYPPLIDQSNSKPHSSPENHEHADLTESNVTFPADFLPDEFWTSALWVRPKDRSESCDSEGNAQARVKALLESVIQGLGLDKYVQLAENRTIAGIECDILFTSAINRIPFASAEIKKPSSINKENHYVFRGKEEDDGIHNRVAGQSWDQITAVGVFGFKKVFGLVTNGNYWRLGCTADILAEDIVTDEKYKRILDAFSKNNHNAVEGDGETTPLSPEQKVPTVPTKQEGDLVPAKKLFVSSIVPELDATGKQDYDQVRQSGSSIISLLVQFVLMSCSQLIERLNNEECIAPMLLTQRMPCRVLRPGSSTFAFQTISPGSFKMASLSNFLADNKQMIHLVATLGWGENGETCLGISEKGAKCCAVKFFRNSPTSGTESPAKKELTNWNNAITSRVSTDYRCDKLPPCRTLIVQESDREILIMPFLTRIVKADRKSRLCDGKIAATLLHFALSGYKHADIKWRHLGYYDGILYLCDLGDIEQIAEAKREKWVLESLKHLGEAARVQVDDEALNSAISTAKTLLANENNTFQKFLERKERRRGGPAKRNRERESSTGTRSSSRTRKQRKTSYTK